MEKRRLGKSSGIEVTPVILGAWAMGGPPFWKEKNRDESVRTIQAAIGAGINMIDTAPVYGFGLSERIVGEAVAGRRDEVYIATKLGLRWRTKELSGIYHNLTPSSVAGELEDSLRRLGTDRIDLYQIHWPDPDTPIADTMSALVRLKEQGKIREIGVSNFTPRLLAEALEYAPVTCVQPKYNMLEREIEKDLIPFIKERGLGAIVYSPLASGMLSGKYGAQTRFEEGDWRGRGRMGVFREDAWPRAVEKIEKLKLIAAKYKVELRHLAIRWVIGQPGVTAAIVGSNTPEQVTDNMRALSLEIPREALLEIQEVI